jgi:hypothetical protein
VILRKKIEMCSRIFQPFSNALQNFYILLVGVIETRGIKENQTVAFEVWTIRNGMDDYRQRLFGTRGRAVPDFRDSFTLRSVNELGTAQRLNEWFVVAL